MRHTSPVVDILNTSYAYHSTKIWSSLCILDCSYIPKIISEILRLFSRTVTFFTIKIQKTVKTMLKLWLQW